MGDCVVVAARLNMLDAIAVHERIRSVRMPLKHDVDVPV